VKRLKEEKNLAFYCDLHGHSRKKNIFMCKNKIYNLGAKINFNLRWKPRKRLLSKRTNFSYANAG